MIELFLRLYGTADVTHYPDLLTCFAPLVHRIPDPGLRADAVEHIYAEVGAETRVSPAQFAALLRLVVPVPIHHDKAWHAGKLIDMAERVAEHHPAQLGTLPLGDLGGQCRWSGWPTGCSAPTWPRTI